VDSDNSLDIIWKEGGKKDESFSIAALFQTQFLRRHCEHELEQAALFQFQTLLVTPTLQKQ